MRQAIADVPEPRTPRGVAASGDGAAGPGPRALAAEGDAVPRRKAGTRRRLLLSFAALAVAFTLAFGSVLVGLARMEGKIAYLHEHEGQMRVVLDLGDAIRRRYSDGAAAVGGAPGPARQRAPKARIDALLARLVAEVDEPDPILWVADMGNAVRRLEELSAEGAGVAAPADAAAALRARDETVVLVFRVEEDLDRLFEFLRAAVAHESGGLGDLRTRTLHLAVGLVAGTLLLAGVLALHLSRSIAGPLAVLGAGASRIARGDLETRIALERADEFGALAAEFNSMAASLRQHQERLVRSEKLAGLGRVSAGFAHELNNPLQVILGYLSLDRDTVTGPLAKHLAAIEREARRCKEIVETLLQLARPAVAVVPVPVDLREVADEVADAVRMALGDAAPAISVAGGATALGTRSRFRQIVFNLARNGADAAGPSGTVSIDVASDGRTARVVVSDTGPGIPPAVRDRIFEPFFTTKAEGTGLGLAIARTIAASLDGELELEDSGAGGARFALRVPARTT